MFLFLLVVCVLLQFLLVFVVLPCFVACFCFVYIVVCLFLDSLRFCLLLFVLSVFRQSKTTFLQGLKRQQRNGVL